MLIIGYLSLLSYVFYITFIIAPLIRIPILSKYEVIGEIIASPIFLFTLILPFILIYALLRKDDFTATNSRINVLRHFSIYLCLHFTFVLFYENKMHINFNDLGSEFINSMVGVLLFFIFHVLFMKYLLKRPWLNKFQN